MEYLSEKIQPPNSQTNYPLQIIGRCGRYKTKKPYWKKAWEWS